MLKSEVMRKVYEIVDKNEALSLALLLAEDLLDAGFNIIAIIHTYGEDQEKQDYLRDLIERRIVELMDDTKRRLDAFRGKS